MLKSSISNFFLKKKYSWRFDENKIQILKSPQKALLRLSLKCKSSDDINDIKEGLKYFSSLSRTWHRMFTIIKREEKGKNIFQHVFVVETLFSHTKSHYLLWIKGEKEEEKKKILHLHSCMLVPNMFTNNLLTVFVFAWAKKMRKREKQFRKANIDMEKRGYRCVLVFICVYLATVCNHWVSKQDEKQ